MRILNLYAGLGGNRKHWKNVQVTAVEKDLKIAAIYARLYPEDELIIADAHEYLLHNYSLFDGVWSSPPCQKNSKMIRSGRNRKPIYPDLRLYEEAIFLKHNFKGKWVIENVIPYYDPLIKPTVIMGRHAFWANFPIAKFDAPVFKNFINRQNLEQKIILQNWLGIHYDENIYYEGNHCPTQVLRNCVHPDIGLHILNEMRKPAVKHLENSQSTIRFV